MSDPVRAEQGYERQLVGNALSLYLVQGLNYLIPLLLLPYLLRALGPQGYGSVIFAQALMGFALILTEFGFNFTAAREVSLARDDPAALARVYWTTMAAKTLLLMLSGVVVSVVIVATPAFREQWQVFAACGLLVVGNVTFPQWYFQGREKLRDMALIQVIARCLVAVGILAFVRSPQDAWHAALILSAPQVLAVAVALCLGKALRPEQFHRPSRREIREAFARSWHMFAASVSTTLYLHTNTLVLGLMVGERAVALYALGTRLVAALQGLTIPIAQAAFPRASLLFARNPAEAWRLVHRIAWLLLPVMGVAAVLLGVFAPTVVQLFGGSEYADAVSVVRIVAAVPVLVAAATVLAQLVMVNLGLTRQLSRIYVAVGVLNLLVLPVLIWRYAADGAALSLTIAEALGPVLMIAVLRRHRADPARP